MKLRCIYLYPVEEEEKEEEEKEKEEEEEDDGRWTMDSLSNISRGTDPKSHETVVDFLLFFHEPPLTDKDHLLLFLSFRMNDPEMSAVRVLR